MPESPIAILTGQGHQIVAAQTGGSIPKGLALTLVPLTPEWGDRQREQYSQWSVTQISSGKRIGPGFEERRDAQKVAEALADLADWTLPEFALLALPGIEDAVRDALDRALSEMDERA